MHEIDTVAIPPYCSGRFQENRFATLQSMLELRRNPTVLLRAIPRDPFPTH
jgi:hypothetical protein